MMEEDTNDEVVSPTEAPSQEYWACVNSLDTFLIPSHSLHTRRSGHREAKRLAHGHTAASGRARSSGCLLAGLCVYLPVLLLLHVCQMHRARWC